MKTTSRVVGIDLGTTYARVAVCQNDSVEIIHNDYGNLSTPSYVAFTDTETILGDSAKIQAVLNPLNTVFDAKRLIGLPFSNPEVQSDIKSYPFSIFGQVSFFDQFSILDLVSTPCIRVQDRGETREFTPEEILSMILAFLKETAEAYLGGTVTSAVVAVPAWFSFAQKQAVWRAATTSGLQVLRLVNENSCSAIAYCLDRARPGRKDNVLILDIGGGGTNVSLTTVLDGVIEVKATTGVHHLGGEDFDRRLVAHLARQFKRKHNTDVTGDARALRRLHIACQRAKHTLSTASRTIIAIDSLCDGIDLYTSITRAEFETLCQDLFRSVLEPIEQVLWDARIDKSGVHELVLVGGSTRIPYIRNIVSDFFDGKQPAVLHPLDPETTVARGAAIQAAILTGNTSEKTQEMLLLDAIPHSLGIRTAGDVMTPLAKRNTTFPMKKTGTFSTTRDDQCDMVIEVYEGERARTKDNALLGRLWLSGIPPAPRGVPHIEVTFELDANESVSVSARDRNAGEESTLCLDIPSGSGELSDMKLATMVVADEEVARQTAAHTRLKTYTRDLRTALRDVDSALKDTEEWLESGSTGTSFATVEEYKTRESELYTVIVPAVLELWKEPEASDSPSSDEAREGAVDEEAVRRWVEARLPSTVEHSDVRGRP